MDKMLISLFGIVVAAAGFMVGCKPAPSKHGRMGAPLTGGFFPPSTYPTTAQATFAVDPIVGTAVAPDGPATNAAAVTPSDTTVLTMTRALYVGGAGNIAFITAGVQTVTMTAVPAGTFIPVRVTKVMATDTTATNIVAFW